MSWKEGRPVELEVLLAEAPGGIFYAVLFYQKKGEGKLRLFTTKALTEEEKSSLKSISPEMSKMF